MQNKANLARAGPGSSKSEARNPKQIPIANDTNGGKQGEIRGFGTFEFRSLELVSPLLGQGVIPAKAGIEFRASSLAPGGRGRSPETKCAKQTQFGGRGPRDCGLRIGDCGLEGKSGGAALPIINQPSSMINRRQLRLWSRMRVLTFWLGRFRAPNAAAAAARRAGSVSVELVSL